MGVLRPTSVLHLANVLPNFKDRYVLYKIERPTGTSQQGSKQWLGFDCGPSARGVSLWFVEDVYGPEMPSIGHEQEARLNNPAAKLAGNMRMPDRAIHASWRGHSDHLR